jgi:hypothetical protein
MTGLTGGAPELDMILYQRISGLVVEA